MSNKMITPESMLASVESVLAKSSAEFDRRLAKSGAEFDRKLEKSRKEFEQEMKASRKEFEQEMKVSRKNWNRRSAELNRQLKDLGEQVGGWNNSHGSFAEEYFINSFKNGNHTFFGEKFDDYENNLKGIEPGFKDEYDFVFFNGQSIGIVEVKFKARNNVVQKIVDKVNTFKTNFPKYQNHRFYLGLAALTFENQVEPDCIDNGIAIIKQVGETVVINDKHLKVF